MNLRKILCAIFFATGLLGLSLRADDTNAPVETNAPMLTNAPAPASQVAAPINLLADATNAPVPAPAPGSNELNAALNTAANLDTNPPAQPSADATNASLAEAIPMQLDHSQEFATQLNLAREQRRSKNLALAAQTLITLLTTNAPLELKRPALLEMALVAQDSGKPVQAQQIYSQYLHLFSDDPSAPEILLRQGLLYRQMGVNNLAISKFYAVMSTALKLKLDNIDYYKKLVLQAQIEIAETHYLEGKYADAADYFGRLLRSGSPDLNKPQIEFKLIRSLSFLTNHVETIAKAEAFLDDNPNSSDVPEVRFLLASTFKKLGRNQESMRQVLLLLKSQQENVKKNPELWTYWQQRAGNDIANQLYKEGDYLSALEIYLSLADLNPSPAWQLPVWYQSALVYEQLQQWQKADQMYDRILGRQKELTDTNTSPSLTSILDMAKWRKDYISWMQKAKMTNQTFQAHLISTNNPPAAVPQ